MKEKKKFSMATKVLIALVLGIIAGLLTQNYSDFVVKYIQPFGNLYMNALKMLIVPLVFCSLVTGMSGMNDAKQFGRIGIKGLILFIGTTIIAAVIGLTLANLTHLGTGTNLILDGMDSFSVDVSDSPDIISTIVNLIPSNPVQAMSEGNMLQIIVFAILVGMAAVQAGKTAEPVMRFFNGFLEIMFKIANMIMLFTPYAVFALMMSSISQNGPKVFLPLLGFLIICYVGFILHIIITYFILLFTVGHTNPVSFLKTVKDAALLAFSTCSSSATIPTSMKCAQELDIAPSVSSFIIPLGSSIHVDGAIIYQAVTTIFLANIFGIHLSISQQITLVLTVVLASLGTAGVAGSSLIMLSAVLTSVGIPVSGIGLVMGVDRLVDMPRTSMNVIGDIVCALVVDRTEQKHNTQKIIEEPQH